MGLIIFIVIKFPVWKFEEKCFSCQTENIWVLIKFEDLRNLSHKMNCLCMSLCCNEDVSRICCDESESDYVKYLGREMDRSLLTCMTFLSI